MPKWRCGHCFGFGPCCGLLRSHDDHPFRAGCLRGRCGASAATLGGQPSVFSLLRYHATDEALVDAPGNFSCTAARISSLVLPFVMRSMQKAPMPSPRGFFSPFSVFDAAFLAAGFGAAGSFLAAGFLTAGAGALAFFAATSVLK